MEKNLVTLPGSRMADYLVVLRPNDTLRSRILRLKHDFREQFAPTGYLGGAPHMVLANFRTWEVMEEKIVHRLRIVGMGYQPFKVKLQNFGSFPSHTIYLNVVDKAPIEGLVAALRTARKLMKSPDTDPYFTTAPHITIAGKLTAAQHAVAWAEYANKRFSGSFIADGMLLIKRREGSAAYQIVSRLELLNLPVHTTQGSLFSFAG